MCFSPLLTEAVTARLPDRARQRGALMFQSSTHGGCHCELAEPQVHQLDRFGFSPLLTEAVTASGRARASPSDSHGFSPLLTEAVTASLVTVYESWHLSRFQSSTHGGCHCEYRSLPSSVTVSVFQSSTHGGCHCEGQR